MPDQINNKTVFTLLEVSQSIRKTLANRYTSDFWVMAEMNKLNHYSHSGHCYPELVDKKNGKVVAQMKAILWKDDYLRINKKFLEVLKEPLINGIKILFRAKILFDPVFGLSLCVLDIDPSFTLGDLEMEKQATIDRMKAEGIYDMNRSLQIPLLPQRIAVISVETSKGYADFLSILDNNPWGFKFFHYLFPSLLQSEKAIASIIGQLKRIEKVKDHFDLVAIVRGGGGDVGLSCYNNYRLAREVATFPVPVITGIGHATNETVVEMISNQNAITPTKLAEMLLQKFHDFSTPVVKAEEKLLQFSIKFLRDENHSFHTLMRIFRNSVDQILLRSCGFLNNQQQNLTLHTKFLLKNRDNELINMEKTINNLHPENILRRGYSITLLNGKVLKNTDQVKPGELIETVIANGTIESQVHKTNKKNNG